VTDTFWAAATSRQEGAPSDGIHLLWTPPYDAGYSLTGYDIQRRRSRYKPVVRCHTLSSTELDTLHRDYRVVTPLAVVSVRSTRCPEPAGDLPDTPFQGDGANHLQCVDLGRPQKSSRSRTLDALEGLTLTALDAHGARLPHVRSVTTNGVRGAVVAYRLTIALPTPSRRVTVTLVHFSRPAKVAARNAAGIVVATAAMAVPQAVPETLTLSGPRITQVDIDAPADETVLLRICWEPETEQTCFAFGRLERGRHPNPVQTPVGTFTVFDQRGRAAETVVRRLGTLIGLDCVVRVVIALEQPVAGARIALASFAAPVTVRARNAGGADVDVATLPASHRPETASLWGPDITELEITAPKDEALLLEICLTPEGGRRHAPDERVVRGPEEPAGPVPSSRLVVSHRPTCFCYRIRLDAPHQVVDVTTGTPAVLAIALREGKAVDAQYLHDVGGSQLARFRGRGPDEVLLYTSRRLTALTICVDERLRPADEAREWAGVPYIATGIQVPVRAVDPGLATAADEYARASSRLIAGEALDAPTFVDLAATLNGALNAGEASPMWYTMRTRERPEDPFIDIRPWPYGLAMNMVCEWRRAMGFGYFDAGTELAAGGRYDYRVTGHFFRRDLEEQLLGFHTVPVGTMLPWTFYIGTVRFSCAGACTVELYPPLSATALSGFARKGIALNAGFIGSPSLAITFDAPVSRVVLELEPARTASLDWSAHTSDYILGLPGTAMSGTVAGSSRVTLDFAEPVNTLELRGNGFLYGIRVLPPTSGDPADLVTVSVVIPDVQYSPTGAPPPPAALGTTNLQEPILPIDPQVTTQSPPQPLGFELHWQPPAPSGGTPPTWPVDLGAVPPTDVVGFQIERRRVDTGGSYEPLGDHAMPILYFGNRGSRPEPEPLGWGANLLAIYPEIVTPEPPVDPWITAQDVLRSAAVPGGPPPGSLHQYRILSLDAVGRRSSVPTEGSVVRLEKHLAPPPPPGPDETPPAGVLRPSGVRARVLQASDPDLADADFVLLGGSTNAVVLEWGWTAEERARDSFATEFRIYWHDQPPDVVRGTLVDPATLVGAHHQMGCTLDQSLPADALKGRYLRAPDYPFKVASHPAITDGVAFTIELEPAVLQLGAVPAAATFECTPMLTGAELRAAAWTERTDVVAIGPGDPPPYVFRDRLTLDATHPRARVWVGVSSADSQAYVPDELPASAANGGRPGNESCIAAAVAEARYIGQPTFTVPAPLPDIPEDVSPEPVGATVAVTRELPALLPAVVIPAGHQVVVDHLEVGLLSAALSKRDDGTVGALFPDTSTASYTLANPADHAALRAQIATGEAARIENRFLMDLLLRYPVKFESAWSRALPLPVPFGAVTDTLPAKAERWLHRIRLVDEAGHISQGAAIVPRLVRVASTRAPGAPELTMPNVSSDTLDLLARARDAYDLKWLVLFALVETDVSPLGARVRQKAQLLRTINRLDLYPNDGLRLRLADGSMLSPSAAVDIGATGTSVPPDIEILTAIICGYEKRASVWAVTMTRDGIPSRVSGPATALTGPRPIVVPVLQVVAAAGVDTATWATPAVPAEFRLERSTDGEVTWDAVSPWLPPDATSFARDGSGTRAYRLVLRGRRGQPLAHSPAVVP
jgi:hypothetical protein